MATSTVYVILGFDVFFTDFSVVTKGSKNCSFSLGGLILCLKPFYGSI